MFLSLTITAEGGVSGRTGELAGLATETNFVGFASLRFVRTDNARNVLTIGSMPRPEPTRHLLKANDPINGTTLAHTDGMWFAIYKSAENRASCDRKISH
jgi:hypothetical protein